MVHRVGERGERNKHIKRVSNTADDLIRVEWNGLGHIEWMVCFNDPYVIVCVLFALQALDLEGRCRVKGHS